MYMWSYETILHMNEVKAESPSTHKLPVSEAVKVKRIWERDIVK